MLRNFFKKPKYDPEDLIREELGATNSKGGHQKGVWILEDFTSPVTGRDYKRHEFFAKPDNVIQWLANNEDPSVLDLRSRDAKETSAKVHDTLIRYA